MARKSFNLGSGYGPYKTFQQCQNAMRAQNINECLDEGIRVFGNDGLTTPGKWWELDEAIEPNDKNITCRTKCGKTVLIYSYDSTPEAVAKRLTEDSHADNENKDPS